MALLFGSELLLAISAITSTPWPSGEHLVHHRRVRFHVRHLFRDLRLLRGCVGPRPDTGFVQIVNGSPRAIADYIRVVL